MFVVNHWGHNQPISCRGPRFPTASTRQNDDSVNVGPQNDSQVGEYNSNNYGLWDS
jgi:hypothetical protein